MQGARCLPIRDPVYAVLSLILETWNRRHPSEKETMENGAPMNPFVVRFGDHFL